MSTEIDGVIVDTIMLIDDSEADNYFHRLVIEEAGVAKSVETCFNAKMALQEIEAAMAGNRPLPDLIFLDINMPGIDGWEFLQRYTNLVPPKQRSAVVVMLSTSVNPADKERAAEIDCVRGYCSKPLEDVNLRELVGQYFK
mgnify:CR=1 FL=1